MASDATCERVTQVPEPPRAPGFSRRYYRRVIESELRERRVAFALVAATAAVGGIWYAFHDTFFRGYVAVMTTILTACHAYEVDDRIRTARRDLADYERWLARRAAAADRLGSVPAAAEPVASPAAD